MLDKMRNLVRGFAVLVLLLIVGHFDDGVCRLQYWFSGRPGVVCDVFAAGQVGLCCGCAALCDLPPRAVADREPGPKAPDGT